MKLPGKDETQLEGKCQGSTPITRFDTILKHSNHNNTKQHSEAMDEDDDDLYGSGPTNGDIQSSSDVPAIKTEDYEDGEEEGEEIEQDDDSDSVAFPSSLPFTFIV